MYYYQEIEELTEEELKKYVQERIKDLELDSKVWNKGIETIGYNLDYNPISQLNDQKELFIDIRNVYGGYIPKGMRIVYGLSYNYDQDGLVGNDGKYYYIDTDDYIYEFCSWIKDKGIINEFELFYYLQDFIKQYFGLIPDISREEMFSLLYKDEKTYFPPVKEHGLSWFKKKGNAMCTEYAVIAQNILSFFDIESYIMIGKEKIDSTPSENHAFNIISYTENETGEEYSAIIDFATPVAIYNPKFEYIGEFPFLGPIEELTEDFITDLNNEGKLEFQEYCYLSLANDIIELAYPKKRIYFVTHELTPDPISKKKAKIR